MGNRGSLEPSVRYQGEAGARYAETHHHEDSNRAWDVEFSYFRPYLTSADTVLDFGCAKGSLANRIGPVVREVHGIEVNPASRRIAHESGLKVFASLQEIPAEQKYDKVVSMRWSM